MERRHRLLTAAALPLVASFAAVLLLGPGQAQMQEGPPSWADTCKTGPQKWAAPTELSMGDTAQVTLVLTSTCPAYSLPIDVVFVVDRSNSMTKGEGGPGGVGTQGTPGGAIGTPGGPPGVDPIPTQKQPPATKDPDPQPTRGPQALLNGRVRGLAQAPIIPTRRSILTLTPGSGGTVTPVRTSPGGVMPTGTAGLIIRRDVVEPPGDEDLIREVVEAIRDFLDQNEQQINDGKMRVGLVTFNDRARIEVELNRGSNGAQRVRSALSRIRGEGNTRIDLGLSSALRVLHGVSYRGRTDLDYSKVAILFSDGKADPRTTARLRLRDDITYISVAVGRSANLNVMRQLASENEFFLDIRDRRELVERVDGIPRNQRPVGLTAVTFRDKLKPNMEMVAGSANPPPSRVMPDGTYEWDFVDPTGPMTVTYEVKPLESGILPVSEMAEASWTDTEARTANGPFPPVELNVGNVPTPESTNTPEVEPTATSTLTAVEVAKYFPAALNRDAVCKPQQATVDVALVIDTSQSMSETTQPGGARKLDAAASASRALLGLLKNGDQASIIEFNADASVVHALSSDIAAVVASLDGLPSFQASGTKIDTGIALAHSELAGPNHRARNTTAMVVVTDGQQDAGQNAAVIVAAEEAKAAGITIWTVGLGQDADQNLLRLAASRPDTFVFAPNAENLELIYEDIARSIPCQ